VGADTDFQCIVVFFLYTETVYFTAPKKLGTFLILKNKNVISYFIYVYMVEKVPTFWGQTLTQC